MVPRVFFYHIKYILLNKLNVDGDTDVDDKKVDAQRNLKWASSTWRE